VLPSGGAVPELVMLPGRYLMGSPQGGRSRNAALVRDGANQLWAFDFDLESPSAVLIGSAVTDPRCTDNTYSWIDPRGAVVRLRPMVQPNAHGPVCLRDHGWSEEDLPVGPIHDAAGAGRLGVENSWALRFGDRSWWLGTLPGWSGIPDGARFSAEQQVIGAVLQSWGEQVDPCLVVVDGGEVWRISERGRVRVLSLDEPVTVGAVGGRPGSPVVAVGTRSGWLHVQPVLAEAKAPWLSFVPRVEER
jgi:hypothetical protein